MIPDLENIILKYASISKQKDKYHNYCNKCKTHKCEKMININLSFYKINLSFILQNFYDETIHNKASFQKIIRDSEILPLENESYTYGWVTNSMIIKEYWDANNIDNAYDYFKFVDDNFEFLEQRNINFCTKCWITNRKIKLD